VTCGVKRQAQWTFGNPQSVHTSDGTSYRHHDFLGSVTDLTDADGETVARYDYDPFGEQTTTPDDGEEAEEPHNPFGYTGQLNDPALTNLQDLRARLYDPTLGRFTSTDPYTPGPEPPSALPTATSRTPPPPASTPTACAASAH
jgi:RHS repeat-associated protein